MSGFVIQYDRRTGDRIVTVFDGEDGPRRALLERLQLEKHRLDDAWEIVSLNSDSLATIQKTHSRYFTGRRLASSAA
ncbi:hypothetical protein ACQ7DA_10670 [Zafaria sp. J156]|uniref:hypothetical protein n=1 Tax=Zafaria sp. J156 TaxID=3116490 RepID=UPI002E790477|nr:hypothetical protein [Zafaria sp. J156]MEE1621641.1 hypothetical protein [Zafaria sp. J156]